jgi:hypothetical protein
MTQDRRPPVREEEGGVMFVFCMITDTNKHARLVTEQMPSLFPCTVANVPTVGAVTCKHIRILVWKLSEVRRRSRNGMPRKLNQGVMFLT